MDGAPQSRMGGWTVVAVSSEAGGSVSDGMIWGLCTFDFKHCPDENPNQVFVRSPLY